MRVLRALMRSLRHDDRHDYRNTRRQREAADDPEPLSSKRFTVESATVIRLPETVAGEQLAVSATLFATYRSCPQQALGRLHGVYPADTIASFRGSLAHRIFARHLTMGPIPDVDLERAFREEIGASDGHLNMKLGPLGLSRPSRLNPVLAEVGDLYARFKRLSTEGFRSAEVSLEANVGNGVTLRGRVDAVFDGAGGAAIIIDWKTGSRLDDVGPQLAFYALIWAFEHDELPERVEAASVRTGERTGIVPSIEQAELTAGEIARMVDVLRNALRSGGDVGRHGGPHCRWCPLLEECAEGTAAVEILTSH